MGWALTIVAYGLLAYVAFYIHFLVGVIFAVWAGFMLAGIAFFQGASITDDEEQLQQQYLEDVQRDAQVEQKKLTGEYYKSTPLRQHQN